MIDEVVIVSKKRAKEMIDESQGDFIVLSKANFPSVKITKESGKVFVEKTPSNIKYSDNNIFGILSMEESISNSVIHNILFAQDKTE